MRHDFTVAASVEAMVRDGVSEGAVIQDVHVRCPALMGASRGTQYVTADDDLMFFTGNTIYPDPEPYCSNERSDRWRRVAAASLSGLLISGGAAVWSLIARRRTEADSVTGAVAAG